MKGSAAPGWHALAFMAAFLFLFALAALIGFDLTGMAPPRAVGVSPTAAMRIVMVLLAVLGVAHTVGAVRLRRASRGSESHELASVLANRSALAWVLGGLVGMIVILLVEGGFILGSTWLFIATARAFGQRIRLASPLIGLALTAAVYAFFTKALSLSLPAGPLERLLQG
jgi:putative tricarboxylic transport membrane protein